MKTRALPSVNLESPRGDKQVKDKGSHPQVAGYGWSPTIPVLTFSSLSPSQPRDVLEVTLGLFLPHCWRLYSAALKADGIMVRPDRRQPTARRAGPSPHAPSAGHWPLADAWVRWSCACLNPMQGKQ